MMKRKGVPVRISASRGWERSRWLDIRTVHGRFLYQVCRSTFERVTGFGLKPGEIAVVTLRVTRVRNR